MIIGYISSIVISGIVLLIARISFNITDRLDKVERVKRELRKERRRDIQMLEDRKKDARSILDAHIYDEVFPDKNN